MSTAAETDHHSETLKALTSALGDTGYETVRFRDNFRIYVSSDKVFEALQVLKSICGFSQLSELGATDYLKYPGRTGPRFEVHYCLLNMNRRERVVVKTGVDDPEPTLPSAVQLWRGADWMEREVFDMYGIRFQGHPDLRRILMPDEFAAYPLRKDYPLRGRGERHNFPRLTRGES
ncbi:MAG: dehydrogenase, subunit [Planctomycetota bacterium]|nr:dehydrogenase, subunit [Planctomycetota bacterium]